MAYGRFESIEHYIEDTDLRFHQQEDFFHQDKGFTKEKSTNYMISAENFGTRKKPDIKYCLSYFGIESPKHEFCAVYVAESWEELLEKATFRDGTPVMDVLVKLGTEEQETIWNIKD